MPVEISSLTYHYPSSGTTVIDGLTMRLGPGVRGLLGENGVGKSTLLGLLSGRLRPSSGSMTLNGEDIARRQPQTLQRIFLVDEQTAMPPLTFNRYVATLAPFYPRFSHDTLRQTTEIFEVEGDRDMTRLSSGQRKKAALSFALATGVDLLLLDEPTNTLDIPSKTQFRQALARALREEATVVISTHLVHDIEALLDHVCIIDRHRVLLDESLTSIAARLHFAYTQQPEPGALYCEPTIAGLASLRPRHGDEEETPVNIELLFNATIKGVTTNN